MGGINMKNKVKESKILPNCGEKQSRSVCEKAAECKQEKIESDANEIRTKYPEIAKMTVAEIVATEMFAKKLKEAITSYRIVNYYAFVSLRKNKTLEPDNFRKEYIACMDKESSMPVAKRIIILAIGNDAYKRTVTQMMNDYDNNR